MRTTRIPILMILSICIIWSFSQVYSTGKSTGKKDTSGFDYCNEKDMCGDTGVCRRKPNGHVCICNGRKGTENKKPCIDLFCPSEQKHIKSQACDEDLSSNEGQSDAMTDNSYCSIIRLVSDIDKECQNYTNSNKSQPLLQTMIEYVSNTTNRESAWFNMENGQRHEALTLLLSSVESIVMMTTIDMNATNYNLTTTNVDIQIQVLQNKNGATALSANGNKMEFHWEKHHTEFAAVSFISCRSMGMLMEDSGLEMENKKYGTEYLQLNSDVLIATVTKTNKTRQNTTFTIEKKKVSDVDDYTVCVYWNTGTNTWSTKGCLKVSSTVSHTVCQCSHLSSFAVLVALYKVEAVCAAVAGILHYLFLVCFMWMLLEGVQLYLMVVKVFWTQSLRGRYTQPIAYGIPVIIVIISAAVNPNGYGTREYCWLSMEKGFRWSFVGPLCVICLANFVFLILTIWKLALKFHTVNPDLSSLQRLRMFIITAIAQLVLLGCTWIIGVFHFQARTAALAYIFTIANSFQGTFIFLLHCVNSKQVRDEYRKWISMFFTELKISKYAAFSVSSHPNNFSQEPTRSESSL
ncbi:adhesion G protein-coupled receptor E2-like isoform X3 [Stegostoma tigrinum]|uniref:adhesion G protein-coupled receptor E2-like isoform X3 n=1 Tax=Stegostoma tigrinum TaxID=3053191 RepID=UPI0028705EED|nr:adhesion G protein-coupled receptor E2-like isoform X3 [Stegostoma tigrinum]